MSQEASASFACFGAQCSVHVIGNGVAGAPADAVAWVEGQLLHWHHQFSRFESDSELSKLNANDATLVHVSSEMAQLGQLVGRAWHMTGGLVDGTLLDQVERAGYTDDLREPIPLPEALAAAPPRKPAAGNPESAARLIDVDLRARTVERPVGVRLDSGGLAKGLFCDLIANSLEAHAAFAIDCAGDVRIGGTEGISRELLVGSPFTTTPVHSEQREAAAAATSGIGRRSWMDSSGQPAHHLLDPSTGKPAFTGLVQVTAFANTASLAEVFAKAALLGGPQSIRKWLPDGGVVVFDDGHHEVIGVG